MGGWADGTRARELGTGIENTTVWVGYNDSAAHRLTTTLSIESDGEQVWAVMDEQAWRSLRDDIDTALATLREYQQAGDYEDTPEISAAGQAGLDQWYRERDARRIEPQTDDDGEARQEAREQDG